MPDIRVKICGLKTPADVAAVAASGAAYAGFVFFAKSPRNVSLREAALLGERAAGRTKVVGLFIQLAQPVDVKAIDDLPVDLVFCLLSPPDAGSEHLKALAQVSRWLRDRTFVAKLLGAGSADAIYALFAASQARDAA